MLIKLTQCLNPNFFNNKFYLVIYNAKYKKIFEWLLNLCCFCGKKEFSLRKKGLVLEIVYLENFVFDSL